MSEQLKPSDERLVESIDTHGESERNLERLQEAAERAEQDPLQKHVESLQKHAEAQSISGKELNVGDVNTESRSQSFGIDKALKADAYQKTLRSVRKQLNAPERALSKVVHQPAIESVSNTMSKTVARPAAFFGGGLGALVGSAVLLYMSRHYGYSYNYAVIFMLFIAGFFAGMIVELVIKLLFRRHRDRSL